ncbi:CVNH domain-containing protein [Ancylobacter defluvii]|uniref:Cyanovirin-N domain-containing protein n=1 Tax=Ancylobacter defluvii TaxID=1282440 RepID=A0A9W6K008_9HYPH|nr:CVNH domain-containing protein [Ancylobacter defluvii]MBS7589422.1 CVNH domain-containing protein [Ancylobacter defluvii]GLK85039.1 hypothetical protein GCM10017653_31090 [Ancylobacter defluvii]
MPRLLEAAALSGVLLGLAAAPVMAQSVPPGSYQQSCQDIRNVAGWLRASCRDRSGRWVEANMAISWCAPGNDISNEDGRLVCKAGASSFGSERPPQGSYMGTCRDVRMSAGWLKATCQDMKGRWVDATTAASWCTGRDIANVDGRLTCR